MNVPGRPWISKHRLNGLTNVLHRPVESAATSSQIIVCHSTKFVNGNEVKATICRISGYIPYAKPGAKPKAKVGITLS
jgi:hypothetical protein